MKFSLRELETSLGLQGEALQLTPFYKLQINILGEPETPVENRRCPNAELQVDAIFEGLAR